MLERLLPLFFVLIWSTGFIAARLVAPHTEPLTFLLYRYLLTIAAFIAIAVAVDAPWPRGARAWANALLAGVLLQGIYLGGVFWAVRHGLPAGVAALVVGLQPLLTAVLAFPLLGETVGARKWVGIALGFGGALLVLEPRLAVDVQDITVGPLVAVVASMLAITLGTIWQKRTGATADIRTNAAVQFIGAAIVTLPVALVTETGRFDMVWQNWVGLLWSSLGLSVGAISLLMFLIRRGSVASVASLFYLVPPVVAVFAYLLFGETLGALQIAGMLIAVAGVAIASRNPAA
ncbi:peptide ABC transporter ATP-binding protein [Salinisphaera orenii MK-B5]|uniref:Peptide ABC transporter ATP-binding protein n=1 Tax=Salinisphaera orenii MK-B5 TaxID=856730 RepID=A0A423PMJ3_9GAMM|nr:DMT family transporter [Salinisphaera orenii]ROO26823.1 peptide ABC transporter ATP-binding protein [Salinisphaera orenii MK-B5]